MPRTTETDEAYENHRGNKAVLQTDSIEQIVKIADVCGLARWTKRDYESEIGREDSFYKVGFFKNTKKVTGFIFTRLIRQVYYTRSIFSAKTDANADSPHRDAFYNEMEIVQIAVAPEHQKKGIGQQLLSSALDFAAEARVETIWLEVRESNRNAIKFYEKNKFETIYRRKNYYANPLEDALVMKLGFGETARSKENI